MLRIHFLRGKDDDSYAMEVSNQCDSGDSCTNVSPVHIVKVVSVWRISHGTRFGLLSIMSSKLLLSARECLGTRDGNYLLMLASVLRYIISSSAIPP